MSRRSENRPSKRVIAALLLSLVVLSVAFAPSFADTPAPDKPAARFEVDFMMDMIDHHMMAVMMAEHCVEKAVREELRMTCEEIITTQTQEMIMMQAWLQEWYGISYEPEHKMTGQMRKLMMLEGAEFEIEFMQSMIKHHERALKEGKKCLDKAYHPELLSMCQNIIETQTAEIEQMQSWLCEWYGICKTSEMEG
jgi:uncharacterized protein (DUF305 family)